MKICLPDMAMPASQPRQLSDDRVCESRHRSDSGILIIECIVYLGLVFVVLGLAYMAFYHCQDFSIGLRRNTDDIERALNAGELWRQDIRSARGQIRIESSGGEEVLRIPHSSGEVAYRLADGELWRRVGENAPWITLQPRVKSSRMLPDTRAYISSWRWELGLGMSRRNAHVQPLFTFQAVPANSTAP
jgi:hypothetical protein